MSDYNPVIAIAGSPDLTWTPDVMSCRFSKVQYGGYDKATIRIGAELSDYADVAIGADVQISWSSGEVAWRGLVHSTTTDSTTGLTVNCVGYSDLLKRHELRLRYQNWKIYELLQELWDSYIETETDFRNFYRRSIDPQQKVLSAKLENANFHALITYLCKLTGNNSFWYVNRFQDLYIHGGWDKSYSTYVNAGTDADVIMTRQASAISNDFTVVGSRLASGRRMIVRWRDKADIAARGRYKRIIGEPMCETVTDAYRLIVNELSSYDQEDNIAQLEVKRYLTADSTGYTPLQDFPAELWLKVRDKNNRLIGKYLPHTIECVFGGQPVMTYRMNVGVRAEGWQELIDKIANKNEAVRTYDLTDLDNDTDTDHNGIPDDHSDLGQLNEVLINNNPDVIEARYVGEITAVDTDNRIITLKNLEDGTSDNVTLDEDTPLPSVGDIVDAADITDQTGTSISYLGKTDRWYVDGEGRLVLVGPLAYETSGTVYDLPIEIYDINGVDTASTMYAQFYSG